MDEELRGILVGRIQDGCDARAKEGGFAITDAAKQVIEMRSEDNKSVEGAPRLLRRARRDPHGEPRHHQAKAADPKQRHLPGLESMPLLITSQGAAILAEQLKCDRYQSEVKRLEKRIKCYSNRRRKPENLAMDQRRLEEMKKLDPRFAKYPENNPDLTLAEAKQLEAAEPPAPRKGGQTRRKK